MTSSTMPRWRSLYALFDIRRDVARIAEALTDGEEEAEDESDE